MSDCSNQFANLLVNIKSSRGNYVRAVIDKTWVDLTTNKPKQWEQIRIIETNQGGIAFQVSDGRYITSKNTDNWGVVLSPWVQGWEIHKILKNGNKMNIYVPIHRKYWSARDAGNGALRCTADKPLDWEMFTIEILTDLNELNIPTAIGTFCTNDQEIEANLVSLSPKPYCGISDKRWTEVDGNTKIKPIFAYLKYITKYVISDGIEREHEFTKEKGIVKSWEFSLNVKTSIGFKLWNAEISLGYNYKEEFSEVKRETWREKATGPLELAIYQPVIIFAVKQEKPQGTKLMHIMKNSPLTLNDKTINFRAITANQAEWIISKNRNKWKDLDLLSLNI